MIRMAWVTRMVRVTRIDHRSIVRSLAAAHLGQHNASSPLNALMRAIQRFLARSSPPSPPEPLVCALPATPGLACGTPNVASLSPVLPPSPTSPVRARGSNPALPVAPRQEDPPSPPPDDISWWSSRQ